MMNPLPVVLVNYWLNLAISNWDDQDHADGYNYNNALAAGSQLYPSGIHKYYDLYSEEGI